MLGVFLFVGVPSQSRLAPCQLPRRGSRVSSPPEACRRPSLASPFGGGGLALARTERARCQRPPRMGCVEALAGCPLSHGCRRASVSAAASVGRWATSHRDVAAPEGEPVSPPPLGGAGAQWAPFSAWSPLPRRSVMDAAHWAASPEPAGESAPAGGGEGTPIACYPAPGNHPLAAPPAGKGASLFP